MTDPPDMTDLDYARSLVDNDWLVTRRWNRLHHATLDDVDLQEMFDARQLGEDYRQADGRGPWRLACGRTAAYLSIPGIISRMTKPRCVGCCRVLGYPTGVGSPKNDNECRKLLGLPVDQEA